MVHVKGAEPEARHQHRQRDHEPQEAPRKQVGEISDHEAEHVQVYVQEIDQLSLSLFFICYSFGSSVRRNELVTFEGRLPRCRQLLTL